MNRSIKNEEKVRTSVQLNDDEKRQNLGTHGSSKHPQVPGRGRKLLPDGRQSAIDVLDLCLKHASWLSE